MSGRTNQQKRKQTSTTNPSLLEVLTDLRGARHSPAVIHPRLWPHTVQAGFPGKRKVLEAWTGEGAAFARYATPQGPIFLKYLPAGWRDERAYRRMEREIAYLRDLAPLSPLPHAPHLHSALNRATWQAHLFTRDLTAETTGWGAFQTDPERERALLDVVRLLARHHAFWAGTDGQGHPALTGGGTTGDRLTGDRFRGDWQWKPQYLLERAQRMAMQDQYRQHQPLIQAVADALPDLLRRSPTITLAHGDIHSGQVLWPRSGTPPILIDFGQVHPAVLGEDFAHLIGIRLNAQERQQLGATLRETYLHTLAQHGLHLTPSEWAAQERAGTAINLLSTIRQVTRSGTSGVKQALQNIQEVWQTESGT